ncbi:MAG: sigma-54 dependent transcriptional regulator [Deltaproteobacteria bacterium]
MPFRNVLVVDDEESMRHLLTVILAERGYEVRAVSNGEDALRELAARSYDLVLSDVRMPRMDGIALLRRALEADPDLTFIVMSAYGSHDAAIAAMKAGAYDYVSKPFKPDEVLLVLRKAEERLRLSRENRRLRSELSRAFPIDDFVGQAPAVLELLRQVRKVAPTRATVLVTGESGTGKELVARALHDLSPRSAMPFVAVNCGAIPAELIESELFGHVRGAFTDASRDRKGLAAEADGGTLFLDEIGELPISLQVKLLRFLEDGEVRPVGATRSEKVDVRVVAATARDLTRASREGLFREDLFYRLNVVPLRLPNLRERPDDIPALVTHFLVKHRPIHADAPIRGVTPEAMEILRAHRWPGNVRQLEHVIERALVLAEGPLIGELDLPDDVRTTAGSRTHYPRMGGDLSVKRAFREMEEQLIRDALERTQGNRTRAAELLDLSYRALLYKIKEYGIDR